MEKLENSNLNWEQIQWEPEVGGQIYNLSMDYISNGEDPEIILFPGLGEERKITEGVIRRLINEGFSVGGIVLTFRYANSEIIDKTVKEAPIVVIKYLNSKYGNNTDTPKHVIGHSQGGFVVIMSAAEDSKLFKSIGSLAPVGLNMDSLGNTVDERTYHFIERMMINTLFRGDQLIWHSGNYSSIMEVMKRFILDLRSNKDLGITRGKLFKEKFDYVMKLNIIHKVERIVEDQHDIRIFVGDKDPVFPVEEIMKTLQSASLTELMEIVPGSHTSLAANTGYQQIKQVVEWVKSTEK